MLMYALRVKSPEPPIPFIILVPHTWVELMLPKISASRAVLMVIKPRRRATSGLLLISCGRRTNLSRKKSKLLMISWSLSAPIVNEQPLANFTRPAFINSTTKIVLFFRFTSLIRSLLLPRDEREITERTPT